MTGCVFCLARGEKTRTRGISPEKKTEIAVTQPLLYTPQRGMGLCDGEKPEGAGEPCAFRS